MRRISLTGAVDAAKMGLITPILVGPAARIKAVAEKFGIDISGFELVDAPHSHASAAEGGATGARGPRRGADEGQPAHRRADGRGGGARTGLRTARRISHCFVMDVPTYAEC